MRERLETLLAYTVFGCMMVFVALCGFGITFFAPALFIMTTRAAQDDAAVAFLTVAAQDARGAQSAAAAIDAVRRKDSRLRIRVGERASLARVPADVVLVSGGQGKQGALLLSVKSQTGAVYRESLKRQIVEEASSPPFPWALACELGAVTFLGFLALVFFVERRRGWDGWGRDDHGGGDDSPDDAGPKPPTGWVPDCPPDFDTLPPAPKDPQLTPA